MGERTVKFSIRGFDVSIDAVEKIIGSVPTTSGIKGQPVRTGLPQKLKRSYAGYERNIAHDDLWDDVILSLINSLGGAAHLGVAMKQLKPEFVQIDLVSPIRTSEEQEDRYISAAVLRIVADLNADIAFGFV